MEAEAIATALTEFINANIMAPTRPIRPDDDLESAGVDSMGLLKVLLYVEITFGFWMPDEDLVQENLASARTLATYVCRRRGPSSTAPRDSE